MTFDAGPSRDCGACARLAAFRAANRAQFPDWWNGPVPSFGAADARLLVVGLAPGLRGANRTGRPFTGDYAGDLLFETLIRYGFASGPYDRRPDDGLKVVLALGRVAHETVLRAMGKRLAQFPFAHGARHALGPDGLVLFDSYHC